MRTSALCFLLAACASAAPKQSASAPANVRLGNDPMSEIRTLDAHIDQQLGQMGLEPPTAADIQTYRAGDLPTVCPQPQTQQCDDVCTLADGICADAEKICNLADQLAGDQESQDKCTSGKLSCERAKQRCCDCT